MRPKNFYQKVQARQRSEEHYHKESTDEKFSSYKNIIVWEQFESFISNLKEKKFRLCRFQMKIKKVETQERKRDSFVIEEEKLKKSSRNETKFVMVLCCLKRNEKNHFSAALHDSSIRLSLSSPLKNFRGKKMLLMHLTSSEKDGKMRSESFFYANSFKTLNIFLIAGVLKTFFFLRASRSLKKEVKKVINGNVNLKIGFRNRFSAGISYFLSLSDA